ncbi:fumarylacetoacetate hydrolase family protein [Rhodococcus sp. NPDC127530]|uniref:fumarylacetoacetate hydrolase family protein n=1 Tax=unclassified Rhodococcus (in: high G+C Gram-positive bacteria) TaxID=192944 RepID=UPI003631530E
MRYATIEHDGRPLLARQRGAGWQTPSAADASILDVIRDASAVEFDGPTLEAQHARVVMPYRPPTIFGIGLNYHDTVREMNWDIPTTPYLFPKLSSSSTGPSEVIVVDETVTTRADWEGELAVIIGASCRNVAPESALDVVFGYTAANDISARDLQAEDGQWVRGKGLDTFCPLGPVVVTKDEIPDPQNLRIRTWLNGGVVQDGNTADMIFPIADLVSYCSRYFTLSPGDVILTGTPAGCGDFRTPRLALHPGDTVDVEVESIGRLSNPVVAPTPGQLSLHTPADSLYSR